jgi:hypothetical protein
VPNGLGKVIAFTKNCALLAQKGLQRKCWVRILLQEFQMSCVQYDVKKSSIIKTVAE